ncbi:hypothetical protein NDU88_001377 [Pleurodeles waltl]|uniref:Uncharacterized protein n=1 Tax=Pleurodeles waltl TaxID=8319 RepID=A0AAV7P702_PLEWA|nr:hypothetical protein NDU88_001377 [Pleurodeles waltl]
MPCAGHGAQHSLAWARHAVPWARCPGTQPGFLLQQLSAQQLERMWNVSTAAARACGRVTQGDPGTSLSQGPHAVALMAQY